jgi:hypothetical protein
LVDSLLKNSRVASILALESFDDGFAKRILVPISAAEETQTIL